MYFVCNWYGEFLLKFLWIYYEHVLFSLLIFVCIMGYCVSSNNLGFMDFCKLMLIPTEDGCVISDSRLVFNNDVVLIM